MYDAADAWLAVAPLTVHDITSSVSTTRGTTTFSVDFYVPSHDDGETDGLTATGYAALTLPHGFGNLLNSGFSSPTSVSLSLEDDDGSTSLGTTLGGCTGNTVYVLMDEDSAWADGANYTLTVAGVPTP